MRGSVSAVCVRCVLVLVLSLLLAPPALLAGEWAGWRGPEQTGVSRETDLVESWSVEGENLVWRAGFAGRSTPVVFDGRVCANGRVGEGVSKQEVVACWDAGDGRLLWERRFGVHNTTVPFSRVGWASVTGDPETGYLFAHGVDGLLVCLDREGKTVWAWRLGEDVGRASGYGGRTHTPIIDENRVILSIIGAGWGQPVRHRFYAFDKRDGKVLWVSTPAEGRPADMNTQSTPVVAVIGGQRLVVGGGADGWIYAVQSRTGEPVWRFRLSQRGINSSVVVGGDTVFACHSEENLDEGTMGRVVAIDGTGRGDVTKTHERWRARDLHVGFSSPLLHEGRLYVLDNSANLVALDAGSGATLWSHNLGTVGKSSPVWGDGRLYVTEVNGRFHILQPGTDGASVLDGEELRAGDRYAEIYGSPAIAYGRVYFATEEGVYCLGDAGAEYRPEPGDPAVLPEEPAAPDSKPAVLRVVPAEVVALAGERLRFEAHAFDSRGRALGPVEADWSLKGLEGELGGDGSFRADPQARSQAGQLRATAAGLEASARLRLAGPLPWSEDFESGSKPGHWIGAGRLDVVDLDGETVLHKARSPRGLHRAYVYMGPSRMAGYTVQADLMAMKKGRRHPDLGLINAGYTLDLKGKHQRLEIRSWAAELRMAKHVPFAAEAGVWYTMKLWVDVGDLGEKALVRGKVWKRGEPEPESWTIEAEDPLPVRNGSPGLYGDSTVDIHYDNVKVMVNE